MQEFIDSPVILTKWVENLALEEMNMDESGVVNMSDHLNIAHILEESSINFMNVLRDRFELYVQRFNELRGPQNSGSSIRIFKISNTVNDFMLFRNSLRLVFNRKTSDLITIGFIANGKDLFAPRISDRDSMGGKPAHEIKATIGPFNKILWSFEGEVVDLDAMTKHYLSEFIRNSSR